MPSAPVDEFFFNADFSEDALYAPTSGASRTIRVIFDNEYTPTVMGDIVVENNYPVAYARAADVDGATNAATLTIQGTAYRVKEVRANSSGISTLILSKRGVN